MNKKDMIPVLAVLQPIEAKKLARLSNLVAEIYGDVFAVWPEYAEEIGAEVLFVKIKEEDK